MRRYLLVAAIALTPNLVLAQVPESQAPVRNLAEFEGHYQYRDGLTLFMVTSGKQLMAIIGDSKYLLRAAGTDTFLNPAGDSIPFVRDPTGRIVAFKENGEEFARLSSNVPKAARLLLKARMNGPNGLPVVYRYEPPSRLPDGIRVGEAGPATLPTKVAEQLVNGVIDGTYPDVRSILIYHKGALLLENIFTASTATGRMEWSALPFRDRSGPDNSHDRKLPYRPDLEHHAAISLGPLVCFWTGAAEDQRSTRRSDRTELVSHSPAVRLWICVVRCG